MKRLWGPYPPGFAGRLIVLYLGDWAILRVQDG